MIKIAAMAKQQKVCVANFYKNMITSKTCGYNTLNTYAFLHIKLIKQPQKQSVIGDRRKIRGNFHLQAENGEHWGSYCWHSVLS